MVMGQGITTKRVGILGVGHRKVNGDLQVFFGVAGVGYRVTSATNRNVKDKTFVPPALLPKECTLNPLDVVQFQRVITGHQSGGRGAELILVIGHRREDFMPENRDGDLAAQLT